jgi:hypothetical protein
MLCETLSHGVISRTLYETDKLFSETSFIVVSTAYHQLELMFALPQLAAVLRVQLMFVWETGNVAV